MSYRKIAAWVCAGAVLAGAAGIPATAASEPAVAEAVREAHQAALFVSGAEDAQGDPVCQIAGQEITLTGSGELGKEGYPVDTLFLIDASTSINQNDQKYLRQLLASLIDGKPENDRYAVVTFGKTTQTVCEFTKDRWEISKAVEGITFQEEGTGLYSTVDLALDTFEQLGGLSFRQLVLFTDGVEMDENGITREELYTRLQGAPYPIHTLGFRHQNNAESLKELFALSRLTGGVSAPLDAAADLAAVSAEVLEAPRALRFACFDIPEGLQDGGSKSVGLIYKTASGELTAVCDMRMPLLRVEQASSAPEPEPESVPEPEEETVVEPEPGLPLHVLIGIGGGVLVLAALVVILLVLRGKKRKKAAAVPPVLPRRSDETQALRPPSDTQKMGGSSGETQVLIDSRKFADLVLIDCENPYKKFELTTQWEIIVGRDKEHCNVVLDYDKSISKRHCRIFTKNGQVYAVDLGSTNKTYVNGTEAAAETPLHSGDVLKVGRLSFTVSIQNRG